MSVDSSRLQDLTPYLHAVWYSFYQIAIAIYMLYVQLGVSCFSGKENHSLGKFRPAQLILNAFLFRSSRYSSGYTTHLQDLQLYEDSAEASFNIER